MKKSILICLILSLLININVFAAGKKDKVLIIATEGAFPPFEFLDEKGKLMGFDIDLIKELANVTGYKYEIKDIEFDAIIPSLLTEKVDIGIAGINITEERKQKLLFSESYYDGGLQIVVPAKDTTTKSLSDLKGKKIGVQIGTTAQKIAEEQLKDSTIMPLSTANELFLLLETGKIDAMINDIPVNNYYILKKGNGKIKVVGEPLTNDGTALAFNKKDSALQNEMNNALATLKKNGKYAKIYKKWFGIVPKK